MSRPVRIGFLGASEIAHKAIGAIEAAGGGMYVSMVGARDKQKAEAFIEECSAGLNIPAERRAVAGTYEDVVTSPDVDVVYISIPVSLRDAWVQKCVQHGKHVVGEKPPADTAEQLASWISALAAKKLLYMDGTMFSHGAYLESVMAQLPQIGRVRRITAQLSFPAPAEFLEKDIRLDPSMEPYGALGDCGWYCVRAALHVMNFQMPATVLGNILETNSRGAVVAFSGELSFDDPSSEDGDTVTASIFCSFTCASTCHVDISGTTGTIRCPFIFNPLTDKGPAVFEIVRAGMTPTGTTLDSTRNVQLVAVPREKGHDQEAQMWRDVRGALTPGADGALEADEEAIKKWSKMAWATQCVVDKLMQAGQGQQRAQQAAAAANPAA